MDKRQFSTGQVVAIVVSICAAIVLAPVGVMAATGSFVNITDPVNGASKARVDSGKLRVGDGSGALTIDGSVKTPANVLVWSSPPGGFDCGASSGGVDVGALNLSYYSKIRIAVQSSLNNQTIIALYPKSGSEMTRDAFVDVTVPANQSGHFVYDAPPTVAHLRIWFCLDAKIYIYGIR